MGRTLKGRDVTHIPLGECKQQSSPCCIVAAAEVHASQSIAVLTCSLEQTCWGDIRVSTRLPATVMALLAPCAVWRVSCITRLLAGIGRGGLGVACLAV